MSSQKLFVRKIVYLAAIAVLMMLIFWLSQPATRRSKDAPGSPGGYLASLRDQCNLSPTQLGQQIDPTSVTIKLTTLGLRGIAANILWEKANDYQMKKDWANRAAVLKQITKVQPNFINVWINQAWNVSYNISVQFRDDYRERYRWVIKGFEFLKEGIAYNQKQPRLQYELGRMISQKIGKADEHTQFRKLFKADDDFNAGVPLALRDNWLVGKQWYDVAVNMVETQGVGMMGQSPLVYHSAAPLCSMHHADGLEKDGTFGEVARNAWINASDEWHHYGSVQLPTSLTRGPNEPIMICLNDQERELAESARLVAQLDAIRPDAREKIIAEKRAGLNAVQLEALDTPSEKRTAHQLPEAARAEEVVATSHDEVARRISRDVTELVRRIHREKSKAKSLIAELEAMQPGLREAIIADKETPLDAAQRESLKVPADRRNEKQRRLAQEAERIIVDELGNRITKKAFELARQATEHDTVARYISQSRGIANFEYWRSLAKTEQTSDLLTARKLLYQGDERYAEGDLLPARDAYREGMKTWRRVIDAYPQYLGDKNAVEDLVDAIQRYRRVLSQLDESFPDPFILQDVIATYQRDHVGETVLPEKRGKVERKAPPLPPPAEKAK
ncbi:MAG: hypothetical protein LLG00_16940 [Planctomycetaceae bacterium]|nr:hypothetical protein [Planctomycetaceae bacterium]